MCKTPYYAIRGVPSSTPDGPDLGSPVAVDSESSRSAISRGGHLAAGLDETAFGQRQGSYLGKLRGSADRSSYVLYDAGKSQRELRSVQAKLRKRGDEGEARELESGLRREAAVVLMQDHPGPPSERPSVSKALAVGLPATRIRRSSRAKTGAEYVRVSRAARWAPWTPAKSLAAGLTNTLAVGGQNVANGERLLVLEGGGTKRTAPELSHLANSVARAVEEHKRARKAEAKEDPGDSEGKSGGREARSAARRRSLEPLPSEGIDWTVAGAVPDRRASHAADHLNFSMRTSPPEDPRLLKDYINKEVQCTVPGHRCQTLRVMAAEGPSRRYDLDVSYPWSLWQAFATFVAVADALDK
mmetsp:Transcript_126668/g.307833  ORF Transcript_126668/g.307833 Transcript_126668/m.307833 type:complete len:357 (+) Transcript_126668:3-1073(+)